MGRGGFAKVTDKPPNTIFGVDILGRRRENYQVIDRDIVERCDVCIIGSGAAGSVLAKKFCDAGRSVVLLEKGGYYEGEDMNQRDEDMIPLLWKNSGANFTYDMRITIAQGSCLGGSTVINDAVCFPIPQVTSRQWREAGVDISDEEWNSACDEVSKEIQVTKVRDDELDRNSLLLKRGCTEAGYTMHYPNSRNCVNCMQCGLCHLGCHYETKQDMKVTYLHKALNDPKSEIRIYCNCNVQKLGQSSTGIADCVEGDFVDGSGNARFKITVNAAIVVVSAGSIASSYLLLRNLIATDRAGRGLALHPAPFLLGDFPYLVRGHQGVPMAYTLHEFGVTNGVEKGGFLVEGIFVPPLQFSILISVSGDLQDELMKRYD
jgi:choline dehydrogenase-like flavoprotein